MDKRDGIEQARVEGKKMTAGLHPNRSVLRAALLCMAMILALETRASASPGEVLSHQKTSDTQGSFAGSLDDSDNFGRVALLGDVNGDGVADIAVSAVRDDDGGPDRGAVWVLFLDGCFGDIDGGGDVDLVDFSMFESCESGPIGPVEPAAYPVECRCLDANNDGDIDLQDWRVFQTQVGGSGA